MYSNMNITSWYRRWVFWFLISPMLLYFSRDYKEHFTSPNFVRILKIFVSSIVPCVHILGVAGLETCLRVTYCHPLNLKICTQLRGGIFHFNPLIHLACLTLLCNTACNISWYHLGWIQYILILSYFNF